MASFRVTAYGLNVRTSPSAESRENLFPPALQKGQLVEKRAQSRDGRWFRVKIKEGSRTRIGWVSSRYLAPVDAAEQTRYQQASEWFRIAQRELGQAQTEPDNPRILEYLATTTNLTRQDRVQDETPWCSAFVNWCLIQAGCEGTNHALARKWLEWPGGRKTTEPILGSIVVFRRITNGTDQGMGHVGFFVRREGDRVVVLGGNQDAKVSEQSYPVDDPKTYSVLAYIDPKPLEIPVEQGGGDDEIDSPYRLMPYGRIYESSLQERAERIADLEAALNRMETEAEREALQSRIDAARWDFAQAEQRARYIAPIPPPHPTDLQGRTDWRLAWRWGSDQGGWYIIDPLAPYNDDKVRNKPGEDQGANIERVVRFLNVENTPRYVTQGANTFCTVYIYDATRLLSAEIPLHRNRAANDMCGWLEGAEARQSGWHRLHSVNEAQSLANQGFPVIAAQVRPVAGHVALVLPVPEDGTPLENDAYIAQAGAVNTSLTRVSKEFGNPSLVSYYSHS